MDTVYNKVDTAYKCLICDAEVSGNAPRIPICRNCCNILKAVVYHESAYLANLKSQNPSLFEKFMKDVRSDEPLSNWDWNIPINGDHPVEAGPKNDKL